MSKFYIFLTDRMRGVRRFIYAMTLAVIYLTASTLSSVSLLLCDHHHIHQHTECEHSEACSCGDVVAFNQDCCNHEHPTLGDNHTDFIISELRDSNRNSEALQLTLIALAAGIVPNTLEPLIEVGDHLGFLDEATPLRVAYLSCETLRAPPAVA